ncbi:DUF6798 domain-containing protein [Candidatus Poribacteria bacterium]
MKDKKYPYHLIAPVTVLSIAFIEYRFAVSDQCIYIPIIRKILDNSLYPGDYLFDQPSGKYTILLPIVAYLSKIFAMRWVFFMGHIVAIFVLSWAIYKLAFSFFKNRDVACIALLLLCASRLQDQAIITHESFFTLQPVATPFCLLSLCFFIKERYTLAVAFNAIAFLIHPIAAAPCFLLLAVYLIFNSYRLGLRALLRMVGVFLLITSPVSVRAIISMGGGSHSFSFFRVASAEWMKILYGRNTYAFPALWNRGSWIHFLSIVALLVISMFLKIMYAGMDKRDRKALYIVIASLASLGMAHLFGSVVPISLIFGLQMARGLYMLMYVAFIYAAYAVWAGYKSGRLSIDRGAAAVISAAAIATGDPKLTIWGALTSVMLWLPARLPDNIFRSVVRAPGILMAGFVVYLSLKNSVFAVIICAPVILLAAAELLKKMRVLGGRPVYRWALIYVLFIAVFVAKVHKDGLRIDLPHQKPADAWTQIQYWTAENTPKEAVFIVPWNTQGFRNLSKRSIVGDNKDGAPGLFSESYDMEWARRRGQLQSYEKLRDEDFTELAREYKASFVITRRNQKLGFPKSYENSELYVYRLP